MSLVWQVIDRCYSPVLLCLALAAGPTRTKQMFTHQNAPWGLLYDASFAAIAIGQARWA